MIDKLIKDKTHIIIDFNKDDSIIEEKRFYQVVVGFVGELSQMKQAILYANKCLHEDGMLYLIYPKLNNKIYLKGIHRDHIFPYLMVNEDSGYVNETDLRFNQMRAYDINQTLFGLKKDKTRKERIKAKKDNVDYSKKISEVRTLLKDSLSLNFFDSLAPGYQKAWARYVFEAALEETRKRRIEEMKHLLNQGIKSKNLEKRPSK
ncbi:conserved hypothetical protein [Paracholeplasma brassicae]|uniref:Bacteriocin-protection, YdeI or OmpD-Associated n=1 Tax=Acholeplasma brassicae TaxID=61635 RepID=U4KSI6_9MOLU|nr:YdeI/OmpD-associated family protein [Paracholeplasma brassicae]CCV66683.1 conserved hypothetical protein [Paracholeplasma brassicae]